MDVAILQDLKVGKRRQIACGMLASLEWTDVKPQVFKHVFSKHGFLGLQREMDACVLRAEKVVAVEKCPSDPCRRDVL